MVERRQELHLTLEARHALGIVAKDSGRTLKATVAAKLGVVGTGATMFENPELTCSIRL